MTCSNYLTMPELSSEEKTFFESSQSDAEKALALINEQLAAHSSPSNLKQDLLDLQEQIKTAKPLLAALKSGEADDKTMETVSGLLVAVDNWLALVAITPEAVQKAFGAFVTQLAGNKVVLLRILVLQKDANNIIGDYDCVEALFMMGLQSWATNLRLAVFEFKEAMQIKPAKSYLPVELITDSIQWTISSYSIYIDIGFFFFDALMKVVDANKDAKKQIHLDKLAELWEGQATAFAKNITRHKALYKEWKRKKKDVPEDKLIAEIENWQNGGAFGLPSLNDMKGVFIKTWIQSSKDDWKLFGDDDSEAGMLKIWLKMDEFNQLEMGKHLPRFDDVKNGDNMLIIVKQVWKNVPLLQLPFDIWIYIDQNSMGKNEVLIKRIKGQWYGITAGFELWLNNSPFMNALTTEFLTLD